MKRFGKQILALLLAVVMCLSLCVTGASAEEITGTTEEGLTYSVTNGEATITGCSEDVTGEIEIPSMIGDYPVVAIGYSAFKNKTQITAVTIPNSITKIESEAFYGTGLTSVSVPASVKYLGYRAFAVGPSLTTITFNGDFEANHTDIDMPLFIGCSNLTTAIFTEGVTTIPYGLFSSTVSLKNVQLPSTLKKIEGYAFRNCDGLVTISIPDSVESIGESAFSGCDGLVAISIPDSVKSIGGDAFLGCTKLTSVTLPVGITEIAGGLFYGDEELEKIDIPDGVTSIESAAFSQCSALSSVEIPDTVTHIGVQAFYGCTSLTDVTIPNSVKRIDSYAFSDCAALETISFEGSYPSIYSDAFNNVTANAYYPGDDDTWTPARLNDYSGYLTWIAVGGSGKDTTETGIKDIQISDGHLIFTMNDGTKIDAGSIAGATGTPGKDGTNGTNGKDGADGEDGKDGKDGKDGMSVVGVTVDENGNFVFTLSDGSTISTGTSTAEPTTSPSTEPTASPEPSGTVTPSSEPSVTPEPTPEPSPVVNPFADVKDSNYYYEAVLWAIENGITSGTSATTFSPKDGCTRGQVVTFLWRAAGEPEVSGDSGFVDVKESAYYADAVTWAVENGITSGTTTTTFSPNDTCTRAQIVTFLYRAANE